MIEQEMSRDEPVWARKVKARMKEQNVSREALASAIGVRTVGAVGHFLSGQRVPSVEQFQAMVNFLQMSASEALGDEALSNTNGNLIKANKNDISFDDFVTACTARASVLRLKPESLEVCLKTLKEMDFETTLSYAQIHADNNPMQAAIEISKLRKLEEAV